jgi:hypothetical protein
MAGTQKRRGPAPFVISEPEDRYTSPVPHPLTYQFPQKKRLEAVFRFPGCCSGCASRWAASGESGGERPVFAHGRPRRGFPAKVGKFTNPRQQGGPWRDVSEGNGKRAAAGQYASGSARPKFRGYMLTRIRILFTISPSSDAFSVCRRIALRPSIVAFVRWRTV